MKIKLTVAERFALGSILPQEGSFATQKVVQDLMSELTFDQKELDKIDYNLEGTRATWNTEKEKLVLKEFDLGKYDLEVITAALKKLDEEEKMTRDHVSLYEKFVK